LIEGTEDLPGPRADGDIVRQIDPANGATEINQKFGRPRDVSAFRPSARMQHIVPANDFRLWIRKQRKCIAKFLRLPQINLRRINAYADHTDTARVEIGKPLLETPQLGVAKWSPKSAIKNEHDGFRIGKQIRKGNWFVVLIRQCELGCSLPDARRSH
jgi:hypothetical protein